MRASLARSRPASQKPVPRDGGEARLWHIGTAGAVSVIMAVVGLVGLPWLARVLLSLARRARNRCARLGLSRRAPRTHLGHARRQGDRQPKKPLFHAGRIARLLPSCTGSPTVAGMMPGMGVGILAFGSIVDEPGPELAAVVVRRFEFETPFAVEFARSSRTRDGAPTLVPVSEDRGAPVSAVVLVLDHSVTVADAREMLYRRETGRLDDKTAGSRATWIAERQDIPETSTCLYTNLPANIEPLTAKKLAKLAVRSAAAPAGAERRDGISYLHQQKRRGLETLLMSDYEKAVLARTGARDLAGAWERAAAAQALDQKEIDLAWDLVLRGLERQPEILADLRGRTGTLLAAAGVVVSVVIGFFATSSSSISRWSWILLLAGLVPAALAVRECSLVLRSLPNDQYNTDLAAYAQLRLEQEGKASGSGTSAGGQESSEGKSGDQQDSPPRKRLLDKRLEHRLGPAGNLGDTGSSLTVGQMYRKYQDQNQKVPDKADKERRPARQKPYRWWRVTLNQRSVRELRDVAVCANPMSTPDDMTEEVTSFLSLARQSNWLVIDQLSAAFSKAAGWFGFQLVLWIAAAAVLHLHGAGAPPHK